jgi:prefoldin subunit 5
LTSPEGQPGSSRMPTIEVSWGELMDKLTILEIKERRLKSPMAVSNVRRELARLHRAVGELRQDMAELNALKGELKALNEILWGIEDEIRAKEASKAFDKQFVDLARSVYINNDKRALLKRRINELLKSELIEEKQYTPYAP